MNRHLLIRSVGQLATAVAIAMAGGSQATGQFSPELMRGRGQVTPPQAQTPPHAQTPPQSQSQRTPQAPPSDAERMMQALASNPIVAPYPIDLFERGGRVVIRGPVGSKTVYDAVVRTAIATGIPFADQMVIDSAAAREVAFRGAAEAAAFAPPEPPLAFPTYGATGGYPPPTYQQFSNVPGGPPSLVYPPPLFGVVDEPFFGFEPPVISYPPYWSALSARRLAEYDASNAALRQGRGGGAVGQPMPGAGGLPGAFPGASDPLPGTVDAEISPDGVVTLRGVVPTMADRIALGQYLARTPGVSQVVNLLRVDPSSASAFQQPEATTDEDRPIPPPPPEPNEPGRPRSPAGDRPAPPPPPDADDPDLDPLADLPELLRLPDARVSLDGATATIEGDAPSAIEAMQAYLAVKRYPGVAEVIDRLRFSVPIEPRANPLRTAPDRRDVEEYLDDQIRRQLGDLATVDRVRLSGDRLDVQGRVRTADDRRRAEATLRSTPVLRGFTIEPAFVPEA